MQSFIYKQNIRSYNYARGDSMEISMASPEFNQFEKAFGKYYTDIEPLYSLIGSFERLMTQSNVNFFKLPAHKSSDLKSHYFIFDRTNGEYVFKECI
ncbi:DUF5960 family protein [Ruoffia sp. FAM 24228]|uniref:DUF5960 family protein n=1 Tax=Ruoffia sp. FAM 24228 TaxID=3259517 RepID=UPI0038888893